MLERSKKTKQVFFIVLFIILLFFTYQFLRVTTIDKIISDVQVQRLDTLKVTIDFIWQRKTFNVANEASVERILDIIAELKVWPTYFSIENIDKAVKTSYHIQFQYEKDSNIPYVDLFIYDKNTLNLNGKNYKIIGDSDIEAIYDLTILAQPENSLDQYYYDLLETKVLSLQLSKTCNIVSFFIGFSDHYLNDYLLETKNIYQWIDYKIKGRDDANI